MHQRTSLNIITPHLSKGDALHLILNNTEDAYALLDKDCKIVTFNKAAFEGIRLHYGREIFSGFCLMDLVPAIRQPVLKTIFADVLKGTSNKTETDFTLLNGEKIYYENLLAPAFDGEGIVAGVVARLVNITDKKKAQFLLQQSEERLRFALEATNQGAWDWNMQTNEVVYSSSYKKMYGFTDDDLKNDIADWESRVHPEDQQKMKSAITAHTHSGKSYYETTYRLKQKNDGYKWILARGKLIDIDSNGKPLRMIGTHTDITEIKEIQEKLHTIAERFTVAAKATGQALWEWNAVTGEAYVSPSFTELFGWEADHERRFESWHSYIHPDDKKQTVNSYYETLLKSDESIWQAEYRFLKADGTYATVTDKAYIIRDEAGKAIKVIGATQDITAQKKTEEELYKSNQRFDNVMKATHDLLWDWDIQANHVYRSEKELYKVYGLATDDSIKKIEQWMERVHPDDRAKLHQMFNGLSAALHQQTFDVQYRFQKDDGSYAHIYDRAILLKDEGGTPLRMIGAAQNVSERKQLEQELLNNELDYKKLINQATVDSQEQERSEIGKELHDNINQVLTTTKLYLELALANEDMMKELVKKTSKTITSVITEIRHLSRSLMDPSIGDLGIVDSIHDLIENINLTQKIWVNLHIDGRIENHLDKKQRLTVYRIIQEALNNILKHANATKAVVRISIQRAMAELIITDNGQGFEQESTKKGAGLKNIHNRVYLIDGFLNLTSSAGNGCTLQINFPLTSTV